MNGRRGMAFYYGIVIMTVLFGFASLAVDYGRVQVAKAQLRAAADAAALAGAAGMNTGVARAQSEAMAAAVQNRADNHPVTLNVNEDIEFGTWDEDLLTFTPLSGNDRALANAIRITARRTKARGNPIPLVMARLLGRATCDVSASAVAAAAGGGDYGVVGLKYIKMGGNTSDSYYSPDGYTPGGKQGSIASNGNIYLSGNSFIHGDARPGIGMTVNNPSRVSGSTASLTKPLYYPKAYAGAYIDENDNANIPSTYFSKQGGLTLKAGQSLTLPGGVYYLSSVNLGGGSSITFTEPVTIYCEGNWVMNGHTNTAASLPKNLKIIMVAPTGNKSSAGKVSIGSSAALYAHIYAPQSQVNLSGNGDFYGAMVGQSIDMTGTSAIHYDTALRYGLGRASLVK